jgi:hypothetical protein
VKRRATRDPAQWRTTNPGYQSGGVRLVRVNGIPCVEIDAGKWWDYRRDQEALNKRGRR